MALKKPDSNSQNLASEEGDEKLRKMTVFSSLKPLLSPFLNNRPNTLKFFSEIMSNYTFTDAVVQVPLY